MVNPYTINLHGYLPEMEKRADPSAYVASTRSAGAFGPQPDNDKPDNDNKLSLFKGAWGAYKERRADQGLIDRWAGAWEDVKEDKRGFKNFKATGYEDPSQLSQTQQEIHGTVLDEGENFAQEFGTNLFRHHFNDLSGLDRWKFIISSILAKMPGSKHLPESWTSYASNMRQGWQANYDINELKGDLKTEGKQWAQDNYADMINMSEEERRQQARRFLTKVTSNHPQFSGTNGRPLYSDIMKAESQGVSGWIGDKGSERWVAQQLRARIPQLGN